jgi:hypothetical protein
VGTDGFTITYKIPNNRFFRNFYFPISRCLLFHIGKNFFKGKTKVKEWEETSQYDKFA